MSQHDDQSGGRPGGNSGGDSAGNFDSGFVGSHTRQPPVSARVPEHVTRGVFSSGALVVGGGAEFIIDFVLRMSRPYLVASRVIIPHAAMPSVIAGLRQNLDLYAQKFGGYPKLPKAPGEPDDQPQPSLHDIYDDLKLADEIACGAYAHGLMASFTPAEFCLDFIAHFLPRPVVTSRVYLAAPQVPRLLDGMTKTYDTHMRRLAAQARPKPPQEPERG